MDGCRRGFVNSVSDHCRSRSHLSCLSGEVCITHACCGPRLAPWRAMHHFCGSAWHMLRPRAGAASAAICSTRTKTEMQAAPRSHLVGNALLGTLCYDDRSRSLVCCRATCARRAGGCSAAPTSTGAMELTRLHTYRHGRRRSCDSARGRGSVVQRSAACLQHACVWIQRTHSSAHVTLYPRCTHGCTHWPVCLHLISSFEQPMSMPESR